MGFYWQHIPEHLNPIVFTVGFFSVRFYALCWLLGFLSAFSFFVWWTKEKPYFRNFWHQYDFFLQLFFGALVGGRLGFVALYHPEMLRHPWLILWPYDALGQWMGIGGMSFHGGLIGVMIVLLFQSGTVKDFFWQRVDAVALSAPLALFFGRIGNFLNGELAGRVTTVPWGMYFFGQNQELRHPSALYEAFGEGVLLWVFLYLMRRWIVFPGAMSALFLMGYGGIRFVLEYFREPEGGILVLDIWTLGQVYSLPLLVVGSVLMLWFWKKNRATIRV